MNDTQNGIAVIATMKASMDEYRINESFSFNRGLFMMIERGKKKQNTQRWQIVECVFEKGNFFFLKNDIRWKCNFEFRNFCKCYRGVSIVILFNCIFSTEHFNQSF